MHDDPNSGPFEADSGPDSETFETRFDNDDAWPPSRCVIAAVAVATGSEPTALRPLYDVVDPDALDAMFPTAAASDTDRSVTFGYEGHTVAIRGDGRIRVFGEGDGVAG